MGEIDELVELIQTDRETQRKDTATMFHGIIEAIQSLGGGR